MITIKNTKNTRNQSTVNVLHQHIFLFDNVYSEGVFYNNTGEDYDLKPGTVVIRDTSNSERIILAKEGAALKDIVGVISTGETITGVTDTDEAAVTYCYIGDINEELLILPDNITLDTLIPDTGITVGDKLRSLGLNLKSISNNNKFDN